MSLLCLALIFHSIYLPIGLLSLLLSALVSLCIPSQFITPISALSIRKVGIYRSGFFLSWSFWGLFSWRSWPGHILLCSQCSSSLARGSFLWFLYSIALWLVPRLFSALSGCTLALYVLGHLFLHIHGQLFFPSSFLLYGHRGGPSTGRFSMTLGYLYPVLISISPRQMGEIRRLLLLHTL